MSRISIPASVDQAPAASRELLAAVKAKLGSVPNLFRLLATSPAALAGYLGLDEALAKGALGAATRERVALAVAELDGCDYCLAAHTFLASRVAKLGDAEIARARAAQSSEPRAAAALAFTARVVETRGHVADGDLAAARAAGLDDAAILEIVAHVALNVLTNYVNSVAATDVDFPRAAPSGEVRA